MSDEKIALLLGGPYGVRVVNVVEGAAGKYRIVEPDPPIYYYSKFSDDPPDECYSFAANTTMYDEEGNLRCAYCGHILDDEEEL